MTNFWTSNNQVVVVLFVALTKNSNTWGSIVLVSLSFRPSCTWTRLPPFLTFDSFRIPIPYSHQSYPAIAVSDLYLSKRVFPAAYSAVPSIPPPASFTVHQNICAREQRRCAIPSFVSPCSVARTHSFFADHSFSFSFHAVDHPVCERCDFRGLIRHYARVTYPSMEQGQSFAGGTLDDPDPSREAHPPHRHRRLAMPTWIVPEAGEMGTINAKGPRLRRHV